MLKMYLEELVIHNFRGFKDYTLKLKPFNVLIGENNSGKTSLLQAIQLVYESIQVLFGEGEHPRFTDINWQVNSAQTISRLGLSDTELIFFKKVPEGLHISAKWSNGLQLNFGVTQKTVFIFELFENGISIADKLNDPRVQELITPVYSSKAIMLPPVGTISPNETFISRHQMDALQAQGRYNETWRGNLFWSYNSGDKTAFDDLSEFIRTYIPNSNVHPPRLSEDNATKFVIEYAEDSDIYDISSGGGGLRTLVSIATILKLTRASCILLDEPDTHLHSKLQRDIAEILLEHSESQNIQMVIATHSPDIIDSVPLDSLLFVDRLLSKAVPVDNVGNALVSLGALTNSQAVAATGAKSIINIEGRGDKIVFPECAKKSGTEFPGVPNARLIASGKKNLKEVKHIHRGLLDFLKVDMKIVAINDLDYDSIAQEMDGIKEEREKGVLILTLGKKEIENYLLDANAITKAVKERLEKRGQSYENYPPIDNEGVIKDIIIKCLERYKNDLSWKIKPLIRKEFSNNGSGWDDSTIEEKTDKKFEKLWEKEEWRLSACPGKDVLKDIRTEIQKNWGVSVSNRLLCQTLDSVPDDIQSVFTKLRGFLEG
jgi:energy-coupling factor transporter ATP-binding protein EcfA2